VGPDMAASCPNALTGPHLTSGKLTYRDFPEESRQYIRTTYSYDSAGRLSNDRRRGRPRH